MVQNGRPLGNMVIKLGLDSSAFSDSLTGATRATKTAVKEMQAGFKVADAGGNKLTTLAAKQEGLTKVIQAQKNELKYLGEAYQKTHDEQGNATSKTAKAAQKYNEAQAKLASYEAQLKTTTAQMARMRVETEGVTGWLNKKGDQWIASGQKITKFGDGVQKVGSTLTKSLTVPLAAGTIAVTKAAIDWESSFAGVKKTVDEVTDANGKVTLSYDDLENQLRSLANELPASHQEIAAVAEAAGQLGIQTENVTAFTKTMIDMGESTNLSAETAATELARFANITQMSQSKFSNLGSSIVDLGNNFATTESEISAMALRLAGAGSQIGMSEGDILGFAAALSSVGIEAEAGGSAFSKVMINMQLAAEKGAGAFDHLESIAAAAGLSVGDVGQACEKGGKQLTAVAESMGMTNKQLKAMYKEADTSATSLQNFAQVAGLTNMEFAKLFKSDPSKAIMKFVEGLGKAEEKGTSAIKVLDDMDITEVRLRDSLLRAANASGIFGDAVEKGNKAFNENTALAEEAGKRYETTESKLKKLKNEAVNAAIDLGGPLVDALRDGLQAAKPLVKGLGDLAEKFSSLDKEQQQNIIKWGALAMAAGPAIKIIGSGISIFGKAKTGVGLLSKGLVELAAKSAEKKALSGLATTVSGVGTAASTAAGGQGVGAMITALGSGGLAGALPLIVGAGGLLAVGYGAWKTFGEEAWNSAGRVREWGVDVGESTSSTLEIVRDNTEKASSQFTLMSDGFSANTDVMAGNFATIGETIEASLIKKIEGLDKLIKELPASVDSATREMVEQEKKKTEESLEIIQQNNDRITEIRKRATDNNRELSIAEGQIIADLAKNTTEEYVKTLDVSAAEKKKILAAMTADVSNASEEEAKLWLQSLGKQRLAASEHAAKGKKEKEQYLKDLGYNLDGEFAKKFLAAWDEINQTTTDGFDAQIAAIARKYPELIEEVHFGSGELISEATGAESMLIESNQKIMNSHQAMTDKISNNALKNAEMLKWSADEGSEAMKLASQTWNNIVFDPKTGEVKTNAKEVVIEATKDSTTWNNMRLVLHNADLDSNAKLVIGEAAIANGWWDGMAWSDKQAVLENEFQQTMFEALRDSGKWNEMTFEEKKAFLYSNTPETMAETLFSLGLWDQYRPEIKELHAENESFLTKISASKVSLEQYNSLSPELKELLAKNPALMTVTDTKKALTDYNKLPPDLKKLLGNNFDVNTKVKIAKDKLMDYDRYTPGGKTLRVESETSAVDYVKQRMDEVKDKYVTIKVQQLMEQRTYAKGTNYHPGGPMIVNDQKGPLYREMVVRPSGESFIPIGKNVLLPNEPVGTKVYTANKTRQMVPRYANGVGVPENSTIVKNLRNVATATKDTINFKVDHLNSKALDQIAKNSAMTSNLLAVLVDFFKANNRSDSQLAMDLLKTISRGGLG